MTSKRVANAKSDKYHGNILKRGKVELQKVRGLSKGCLDAPHPHLRQNRIRRAPVPRPSLIGAEGEGARSRAHHARLLPLRGRRLRCGQIRRPVCFYGIAVFFADALSPSS